jgi:hypothetical protein
MSKLGLLTSLRSGDFIIIPRGGEPLRTPAFAGAYGRGADRNDPQRKMRKLLRAMVALKAQARKK